MKRYAAFNEDGRSTVITNLIPEGEEGVYFAVPASVTGVFLVKEGSEIRDLSAEEAEAQRLHLVAEYFTREIRAKRNRLLVEADILTQQDRWEGYSDAKKKKITAYKQALRDITKQKGFPKDVTFPEMPV